MPSSWACGVPSSVTVVPSRSTVRVTGSPSPSRIDSARSSASPSVPFTATISSPGWRPAEAAGEPGTTSSTVRRRAGGDAEHEHDREREDREDQVRERAGGDDGDALARRRAPVGVVREPILGLGQAAVRHLARVLGELRSLDGGLEVGQTLARVPEAVLRERRLDRLGGLGQRGRLLPRGAEMDVEVAGRRPVHPRDLHVAAERDRADAVLDSVALPLRERGREEDVELPRPHLDRERGEEVPGLVDEDQEGEAPDGDCDVHGCS